MKARRNERGEWEDNMSNKKAIVKERKRTERNEK